jgi:TPR repeat protein
MKALVLTALAVTVALPSFGQVLSARRLTEKVAPQPQAPARPVQPAYQPAAPQSAPRALTPAEQAKARAEKDKNAVKQLEFYKKRAEEGSDHAQYELGMRYLDGKGTPPDKKLAREWLAKAAKQGHSQAAKKLNELGPDPEKADAAAPVKK